LYVGGEFVKVAGQQQMHLTAFDANNSLIPWYPNVDGEVRAVAVGPTSAAGETLYIGGRFDLVNSQVRRRIAQVDQQGQVTAWNPWGYNPVTAGQAVNALAYMNGTLYAAGAFSVMGRNLAQIDDAGMITPIQGLDYQAWSLAVSGGKLTVGGDFTMVSNLVGSASPRNHVATIDLTTKTLTSFAPNVLTGTVYALAPEGASMHLGGTFTQINDQLVSGFATLAQ
jgi:hypothetical protein